MSSSPTLLNASFAILTRLLNSKSALLNPDRNPVLRFILRKTFYDQFCAGENRAEVQRSVQHAKALGYQGVVIEYALEVLGGEGQEKVEADTERSNAEVEEWRTGMLETVKMAEEGDFVALKWSGLGSYALELLRRNQPPTPAMENAIHEVCDLAAAKGVAVLPGAEEEASNAGIDSWSLKLQSKYNRPPMMSKGKPVMYNTYQAYLKSTPAKLAKHLVDAEKEGYVIGVKMVRGAYLASEPRERIWPSIEKTHEAYDGIAEALLRRQWNGVLKPDGEGNGQPWPELAVVLATHNQVSIEKAQALRDEQAAAGEKRVPLAFVQLWGMADEVSCEILEAAAKRKGSSASEVKPLHSADVDLDVPRAFKCVTWGTTGQCLNFLLRRAAENKDAAARTEDSRRAMQGELWRRLKGVFGLS
ncbi:proline dehydrogenase [Coniosporium tulheliwenetii]|uniref:Proline dehydrogenase n=1 Tax=Coniosporium tulheliwenetii TaxID=3383036 RepID=A0ACC2YMQ3_9PEZI|nr:proline dehydrogenase [Cladosporium sp. JES 115]